MCLSVFGMVGPRLPQALMDSAVRLMRFEVRVCLRVASCASELQSRVCARGGSVGFTV